MVLASQIIAGVPHVDVAKALGMTDTAALDRWRSFQTRDTLMNDGSKHLSLDGQKRLLNALRYIAEDSDA